MTKPQSTTTSQSNTTLLSDETPQGDTTPQSDTIARVTVYPRVARLPRVINHPESDTADLSPRHESAPCSPLLQLNFPVSQIHRRVEAETLLTNVDVAHHAPLLAG